VRLASPLQQQQRQQHEKKVLLQIFPLKRMAVADFQHDSAARRSKNAAKCCKMQKAGAAEFSRQGEHHTPCAALHGMD